ncbi:MAG TPA: hypothetical protein VGX95_15625 [Xanthobacteraceae bacterium]|jgi:hypothetical protein|nr:hypothetical protein [Xanthobacteraceae bacterium]
MATELQPQKIVRRKIDFGRIGNLVLVLLYHKYISAESLFVPFSEIASGIPNEPRNAVWDELNNLRGAQKVTQQTQQRYGGLMGALAASARGETYEVNIDGYKISRKGIEEVNGFSDELYEIFLTEIQTVKPVAKAVDSEKWEPLPLDRQSTEFAKAVEATDIALKEIEGSNGYAAASPEERNSIVETIKANLKTLKDGLISKGQIIEGLIKPLMFIAKKFADASIGELSKRAANFLWTLITGN